MRQDGNKGTAAALPWIVTIGGGTGSYQALRGLRDLPVRVSAVVSVFDSGGSSGAIREELGQLPPGDIR
ncbi:MAG: 2-phospho-L-lactate transferase CofD family protein, partial [Chloroflexota bacterium]|nr:2-phospho-L-lactate transferase CofD family protein [Chloroflexota bacterium]